MTARRIPAQIVWVVSAPGRYTQEWFSFHEAHWRRHFGHLAGRPALQAVEVGSYEGRSACWIVQHLLAGENSRLICVEPFQEYEGQSGTSITTPGPPGAQTRSSSCAVVPQQVLPFLAEESFDFVYVDGSPMILDVLQDAAMCWRLVRPRGILVFDDYEHALFARSRHRAAKQFATRRRSTPCMSSRTGLTARGQQEDAVVTEVIVETGRVCTTPSAVVSRS